MGEAGPEAVMPLTRTRGGDLGVKAAGGINVEVNVINQGGQQLAGRQKGGPRFDGKKLIVDVIVDDYRRQGPIYQATTGLRR